MSDDPRFEQYMNAMNIPDGRAAIVRKFLREHLPDDDEVITREWWQSICCVESHGKREAAQ